MPTNTIWFHFYEVSRIVKFIVSESALVETRALGWGVVVERSDGDLLFNGTEFRFRKVKNSGIGWEREFTQQSEWTWCCWNVQFRMVKILIGGFILCDFHHKNILKSLKNKRKKMSLKETSFFCQLLAVWPWTCNWNFLCHGLFICKRKIEDPGGLQSTRLPQLGGFPGSSYDKEPAYNVGDLASVPATGRFPWRRE